MLNKIYNVMIESGMIACFVISLYYTSVVVRIALEREDARERYVAELHCKEYGKWINNWASQRNMEKPCK